MSKRVDHKILPAVRCETAPLERNAFTPCAAAGSLLKKQPAVAKFGGGVRFCFPTSTSFETIRIWKKRLRRMQNLNLPRNF